MKHVAPIWVHRYAVVTSLSTLVLLGAGALVTGTGSGLAVPDWPLSYGQFFPRMVGGVLFEHGHRLVAGTVAILMIGLCLVLQVREPRRWVRNLAFVGVGAVLAQASLGGLTVLLRLPKQISIAHACLAQLFFTITVLLAFSTSKHWESHAVELEPESASVIPLRYLSAIVSLLFFYQLLMGATVRHFGAGLAITDFPTAFGGFLPPHFTFPIAIHFAHRMGAFALVLLVAVMAARVLRDHTNQLGLTALVGVLCGLVAIQLFLGAMIVWMKRPIPVTTVHLMVGAMCLATSVVISCRTFRLVWMGQGGAPRRDSAFSLQGEPA